MGDEAQAESSRLANSNHAKIKSIRRVILLLLNGAVIGCVSGEGDHYIKLTTSVEEKLDRRLTNC